MQSVSNLIVRIFIAVMVVFNLVYISSLDVNLSLGLANALTNLGSWVVIGVYVVMIYLGGRDYLAGEKDLITIGFIITGSAIVVLFCQTLFITLTIHRLSPSGLVQISMDNATYNMLVWWWKAIGTMILAYGGLLLIIGIRNHSNK